MRCHYPAFLLVVTIIFTGTRAACGEEAGVSSKTWEEEARESGLSQADVSALQKHRILITDEAYKQIFSAYLSGGRPLFITSDSLLNAYHVLYEESVLRLEQTMASRLPGILRRILTNLEYTDDHLNGKPALVLEARRRAMLVPGIALRLMHDSFQFEDPGLNAILDQETERIVRGEDIEMPEWLGKPDASFTALDYSRYKPRGFYTRSELLSRYFRAVSWLQSIPFRVSKDQELLAVLMLGNSVTYSRLDDYAKWRKTELFFRVYRSFIGAGDDWDIVKAAHEAQNELRIDLNGDDLQQKRDWLKKAAEGHGKGPLINDQIRFAPDDPGKAAELSFRIVSPYRTPSAILFQRTTDLRRFTRRYPDGLEVAASLGSMFARTGLSDPQKEDILETIDSCKKYFEGESLYLTYLDALKALLDAPEPDAPDFMKNEAWQIKSCGTALAGWAQLRHTWALQAKQTVHYLGAGPLPEGFVEPEPEFFARMADLADATGNVFKLAGPLEPDHTQIVRSLQQLKGVLDAVKDENEFRKKLSELPQEDLMDLQLPLMLLDMSPSEARRGSEAYFKEKAKWLDTVTEDIRNGRTDRHPTLEGMLEQDAFDIQRLWETLEKVSRRLQVIAHKQLRGVDLNGSETAFIEAYGTTIAGIMLYGGNSYLTPRDDAPRVVDLYANPQEGGYLHVGVARPRKLYVLYPWQGKTILCRGAVMPYYEFVARTRLTDQSWLQRLDSKKRPSIPKWMSPIVSEGSLSKPELKDHH